MRPASFGREIASTVMKAAVVIMSIFAVVVLISWFYEAEQSISDGSCNIAVLPIEGVILPYHGLIETPLAITPEVVDSFITAAEQEDSIKGILIKVDSGGGTPVASQRIAERIRNAQKPVVGLVGDMAASGGYMVAAAADQLVASPMSTVGSIGVNMSYLEGSQKNEEEGVTYVQLISGKFKDAGTPFRPITDEERDLFMEDLDIVHDEFVKIVSEYRNLPIADVENLADGAAMPGTRALEHKLIDTLGGIPETIGVIAALTDLNATDVRLCEYVRPLLPF